MPWKSLLESLVKPAELGLDSTVGAAFVTATALVWNEWRKRQAGKKPDEMIRTQAVQVAASIYGELLKDTRVLVTELRTELIALRVNVHETELRAAIAEKRADAAETRADMNGRVVSLNQRNLKRLRAHILACTDMMQQSGMTPPDFPDLE